MVCANQRGNCEEQNYIYQLTTFISEAIIIYSYIYNSIDYIESFITIFISEAIYIAIYIVYSYKLYIYL